MQNENWIWGFHSLEACLENSPEVIFEILIEQKSGESVDAEMKRLMGAADLLGVKTRVVPRLPRLLDEKRTQGVAALLKEFPEKTLSEVEEKLMEVPDSSIAARQWLLLDGIQDPRNFGALLRSAAAFDVSGVFIRDRHQCPPNGVVAQASAGALFRIPIVVCSTFNPVFKVVENAGIRILGLAADGLPLNQVLPNKREGQSVMWILGGEGGGIRPGLREKCHAQASIPMRDDVESLNASVAASIAFFVASQKLGSKN